MPERLHCTHCQEVIGVYEPLMALLDGAAVEASRASRPDLGPAALAYHRDCFAALQGHSAHAGRNDPATGEG